MTAIINKTEHLAFLFLEYYFIYKYKLGS